MERTALASPRPSARIIGLVYLLYFLTAILGVLLLNRAVGSGDADASATSILAHESLYRLGVAIGLISLALYLAVTALLYGLLKPVNNTVALVAALVSVVGCAIQGVGSVFLIATLLVLGGSPYLSVFSAAQLHAHAQLFQDLYAQAGYIAIVFFGVFDVLIGYLIFKSTFLPRFLGVLMAVAGLGWLTFLSPSLAKDLSPGVDVLGFVAELALWIWLLVMGIDIQRWREQTEAASAQQ
jgi:uncharacterized protein DUF4386